ncbi:MarR family winged helix-turn-helix transcriptional regulator [Streptacidiphilus carbonis]|jgi:DNA-binding MarR family transcriptional regulator|uniref:MarR family winged helix-turn-helix transcriptional regulator n=1 Tax=Streptacidiphilus carbonis TaxID=105422 RepID=UPI0005A6FDEF|nr:MarR family transcriptional regulator [Streptacidiphilus carbonis]
MDDVVEAVLQQWRRLNPELDTAPMALIGRVNRCSALLQQAADAPLTGVGLTRPEFDILGTLRRVDRDLTPGRLARETFASGAAVTKRVRLLADRGLVERRQDARDRRVVHLSLTDEGRDLIDRLLPEQLAYERSLLSGIGEQRQGELSEGLSELLSVLEGRLGSLLPY